jgi:outer membrane lipoprotein-sorting protein
MLKRLSICLVLSVFVIGVASAQVGIRAAAKNTWLVSGSGSMTYVFSSGSGEDSESGDLSPV